MALNVVGLFDTQQDAQSAVQGLKDAGFSGSDISFLGSNARGEYGNVGGNEKTSEAAEGAGFGATGGAVLGGLAGLLVGLGALVIPGIGPVIAAGTLATTLGSTALGAGIGAAAGGLTGALVGAGIPENDADVYAEGVRRGGAMIMVQADNDDEANRAADVMNRFNVVDIDRRGSEYRTGGWERFDETAQPYDYTSDTNRASSTAGTSAASATTDYSTTNTANRANISDTKLEQAGEIKVPIVEEELRVGKRQVEGGGVRVYSRVKEQPVNEQVTLREERVNVERTPVDRPVSDADLANLREGTFEVRERAEEAIVDKQARVVEEVHVKKNVQDRTETVQDTVRRTDVQVEQVPGQTRTTGYTETTGTTGTGHSTTDTTMGDVSSNEGTIERGASKLGNVVERGTGTDLDRDGDVGQRDTRNNY